MGSFRAARVLRCYVVCVAVLALAFSATAPAARAEDTNPPSPLVGEGGPGTPGPGEGGGTATAPLHDRIDALVESANLGPVAAPATDADFLRRAYLDLTGTIPSAQIARAFLDDSSPNKRATLVDRLLAAPQFARHMARVFDVVWTERRAEKGVKADEWREYLRTSFAAAKPLNQLIREILSADGVEPTMRPAAKFYLDREADANLIARDVGRLFFGRDFQCAQCHDHPLVADYSQADYHGLVAFVNRGVLFTGKDKQIVYAENADGEVNYKSVFTGDARDRVVPKLPEGAPVAEPLLSKEEQYVVAPDKGVRPVPKYSRRAQLAAEATSGASAPFNRNLANRLWAHMMGRGLTHPLDMHHSGNPSVNAQLLAVLADELLRMKFDAKAFLRELALTRTYQRSSEIPDRAVSKLDLAAATSSLTALQAESQRIAAELEGLKSADAQATTALSAAYEQFSKSGAAREAAQKAQAEAKKASDEVATALAAAIKEVDTKADVLKALVEARDKTKIAVAKLPDDKPLVEAAKQFRTRTAEVETQLAEARKQVTERTPQTQAASLKIAEVGAALDKASAEMTAARAALDAADTVARAAVEKLRLAKANHAELAARITDAQAVVDYEKIASTAASSQSAAQATADQLAATKSQTSATAEQLSGAEQAARAAADTAAADRKAAEQAWTALADRSTVRFTQAPLKPLSPEQLAWSMLQAVGFVDQQVAALESQVKKDVEADLTPEARAAAESRLLEERVDEKLKGVTVPFVALFAEQAGQAASFSATVHQALFLANGELLTGWLKPSGNNLPERLAKMDQPAALADELYLSVLSRRPTADEQASVARYCEVQTDRAAAVREMVWSLVASAEFRFNH